jgi:hypothetical protein
MSDQDFELEGEELAGEWEDCEDGEEPPLPIECRPIYSFEVSLVRASIVVKIFDKKAWYLRIIRRLYILWSEVNPRKLKCPGKKQSFLHKLSQKLPDNMDPKLIDSAITEYQANLPMREDSEICKLMQEIELYKKECYIQVFIKHDSQNSMLKCSETISCIEILKDTWDIIVKEMLEYYPTNDIYIFVPETIFSQNHIYRNRYKKVEGLVSQAQADATWEWLLENGFKYCGDIEHDKDKYPWSYGTQDNYCPYFIYEHKPTIVPE